MHDFGGMNPAGHFADDVRQKWLPAALVTHRVPSRGG